MCKNFDLAEGLLLCCQEKFVNSASNIYPCRYPIRSVTIQAKKLIITEEQKTPREPCHLTATLKLFNMKKQVKTLPVLFRGKVIIKMIKMAIL